MFGELMTIEGNYPIDNALFIARSFALISFDRRGKWNRICLAIFYHRTNLGWMAGIKRLNEQPV